MSTQTNQKVPVQARVDIRHLAAFARFMNDRKQPAPNRSRLIDMILAALHDLMTKEGLMEEIKTFAEASSVLSEMGLGFAKNTPPANQLLRLLSEESLEIEKVGEQMDSKLARFKAEIERELGLSKEEEVKS